MCHECTKLENYRYVSHFLPYRPHSFMEHTMAGPVSGHKGGMAFPHNYEKSVTTSFLSRTSPVPDSTCSLVLERAFHLKYWPSLEKADHPAAYANFSWVCDISLSRASRKWGKHHSRGTGSVKACMSVFQGRCRHMHQASPNCPLDICKLCGVLIFDCLTFVLIIPGNKSFVNKKISIF